MKLYSSYLTRKIISYLLVIVFTLILLIWFAKAISFIGFIIEKGVSLIDFFNLFVLILPWILLIIIPIAFFSSVLIGYNQMINYNEIVILKNSGLNNIKLAKPVISIAIVCCLICYLISFFIMPFANKKLRTIKSDVNRNYINLAINPGIFENLNSLTIYVKDRDANDKLSGILIYDRRNKDYSTAITSSSGHIRQSDNAILLYLSSGTAERFHYKTKKTDILNFDSYVVNLIDNGQVPQSLLKWKASERYIGELINPDKNATQKDLNSYYVELHQRITYPLLSIVFGLIAVSFMLSGNFSRRGQFNRIIYSIICAGAFIALLMLGYSLINRSRSFTPFIYLVPVIFIILSFYILNPKLKLNLKLKGLSNAHNTVKR